MRALEQIFFILHKEKSVSFAAVGTSDTEMKKQCAVCTLNTVSSCNRFLPLILFLYNS